MKWLNSRNVVRFWLLGFIGSFLIQTIGQSYFASVTLWQFNHGWQNEIAIWNLGLVCILVPLLKSEDVCRSVLPGLFVLSAAFAANHAWAIHESPQALFGNIAGCVTNLLAIALVLFYWLRQRAIRS